jgi:type II restriction enzyme
MSYAEAVISDALQAGKALCKVISRNDVGATGAHQCGFYLPRSAWQMFSSQPPIKGVNHKAIVRITWPEKFVTDSAVTWYGQGTRSEYRLTRFGKDFPWLHEGCVGCLLVLIPFSLQHFSAYVIETEDEIENIKAALGVETLGGWGVFTGGHPKTESEDECLKRVFNEAIALLSEFPPGIWMASRAREAVSECAKDLPRSSIDERLLRWIKAEYQLFRTVENKLCLKDIQRQFHDVDEFVNVSATIMNRRKSRAGHSLEYHVEELLQCAGVPFDRQPRIDGKVRPDILFPGKSAYDDHNFPTSNLVVMGIKTTCKDRWRQILNEGKRVSEKHLLTLQEAISRDQLLEMRDANVTLVVPKPFHKDYDTTTGVRLLSIEGLIKKLNHLKSMTSDRN